MGNAVNYGSEQFFMCPMFVTECFHNKCLNCQACVQFIFSPGCESDMILSVMTLVNHIEATKGPQGKHLKFPITKHPKGPYKHHIMVRVDTGADVNCMNEKTFNELFPEVELSVCPHEMQNFGNLIADISILG